MKWLTIILALVILGGGAYYYFNPASESGSVEFGPDGSGSRVIPGSEADTNGVSDTGGAETRLTENDVAGTWRSTTDAKFTREIRTDGIITDRYEGDATAGESGGWQAVDLMTETVPGIPAASLAGKTVIKVTWGDGTEVTYFTIDSVTRTTLVTTDLSGRGAVTTYTRVQ
jgi:hypothetical protein